jgi:hypothetical protein
MNSRAPKGKSWQNRATETEFHAQNISPQSSKLNLSSRTLYRARQVRKLMIDS